MLESSDFKFSFGLRILL